MKNSAGQTRTQCSRWDFRVRVMCEPDQIALHFDGNNMWMSLADTRFYYISFSNQRSPDSTIHTHTHDLYMTTRWMPMWPIMSIHVLRNVISIHFPAYRVPWGVCVCASLVWLFITSSCSTWFIVCHVMIEMFPFSSIRTHSLDNDLIGRSGAQTTNTRTDWIRTHWRLSMRPTVRKI